MRLNVVHVNDYVLIDFAGPWRLKLSARFADHDRARAEGELGVRDLPVVAGHP
jgi:hypothetical protein